MLGFILAFGAMLCFGIQNFLYAVAGRKNLHSSSIALIQMLTVATISLFIVSLKGFVFSPALFFFAFFNSFTFVVMVISRIEALKYLPGSIVFTVSRASVVVVALVGIVFLGEKIYMINILGIAAGFISLVIFTFRFEEAKNWNKGLLILFISLISGVLTILVQKFAISRIEIFSYIFVSYIFHSIFSSLLSKKEEILKKESVKIGIPIGISNFLGFLLFLEALKFGKIAIVAPVYGMYFAFASLLSFVFLKEKITKRKVIGILWMCISLVLLAK